MKYDSKDIFTPQGLLGDVQKNPNLDFLMNIFNVPRAFGVSGFGGNWNVGMHSVATAFIALYWAKFNTFNQERTHKFVSLALLHDLHEAVTGDVLPMFKLPETKKEFHKIQSDILAALKVKEDKTLEVDLKIVDLIAFLYEIKQVSPNIQHPHKLKLARMIADKQKQVLYTFGEESKIKKSKIFAFLKLIEL